MYEHDNALNGAFSVRGYRGIAWRALGWEVEPDEDTEWTGLYNRTGKVVCVMIGDDSKFAFDRDELTEVKREDYCGECGQIGCAHDGLDRGEIQP